MKAKFGIFSWVLGSTLLAGSLTLATLGIATADSKWHDDDDHEEHERYEGNRARLVSSANAASNSPQGQLYAEECSACHIAYPAALLPSRSWNGIMMSLNDHFGENAELDTASRDAILTYLVANSAEQSGSRLASKLNRGLGTQVTPLRITELPYFKRKHDEIPKRLVENNPEVGSFSQCQACHGDKAQQGYFDEDTVNIPGYGRWDD